MGKSLVNLTTRCLRDNAEPDKNFKTIKLNCNDSGGSDDSNDNNSVMIKDKIGNCFCISIKHLSDNYLLNDTNLIYRAEGNANLVLSLPDSRQVLRFRKSFVNDAVDDTSKALNELKQFCEYTKFVTELIGETYTCQPNFVYCDINDYTNFNRWLLNYRPTDRLDKEIKCQYGTLYPDVAFLPNKILSPGFYPSNQVVNSTCSTSCSKRNTNVTIHQSPLNFISEVHNVNDSPDTYCIEIKPKQGWHFFDDHLTESKLFKHLGYLANFEKIDKCRYCCMQYLKLCKGTIKEISSYCPIDLFSGISKRMRSAIIGLIKSPQNNLRVFKNGQLVYGDKIRIAYFNQIVREIFMNVKPDSSNDDNDVLDARCDDVLDENDYRLNLFIKLLTKMLLKNYQCDGKHTERYGKKYRRFSQEKCSNLNENCALQNILSLQLLAKSSLSQIDYFDDTKILDEYINEILLKWKNLINESFNSVIPQPSPPSSSSSLSSPMTMIGDQFKQGLESCISICMSGEANFVAEEFIANKLDNMEKYLIGATALDCSMMLAFQKVSGKDLREIEQSESTIQNRHFIKLSNNLNFLTNITIMDLDPKSTSHYKKYLKQTELSYLSYYNYLYGN